MISASKCKRIFDVAVECFVLGIVNLTLPLAAILIVCNDCEIVDDFLYE